jgi:serine/threonine protein kinase
LVHIAAALGVGPSNSCLYGFDLVAFRDEIVFCMEFCEGIKTLSNLDVDQIKHKLRSLHRLQIVHLDIKPENIGFSPLIFSPVFIDFGFSKVLKEELGSKTLSSFMGSINYCCKEMVDLYVRETEGYIDLYYNDAVCLSKLIS